MQKKFGLYIPLAIVYLSAILVLLDFFTTGLVQGAGALLSLWVSIILAFALLMGLGNIFHVHVKRVLRRESGFIYSIILLTGALAVIIAGLEGHLTNNGDSVTNWIYQYVYQPLATTLFSLMAFLMVSAAVKILRIGTVESTLLTVGALVVLVGQVAFQPFSGFSDVAHWFETYPVLGVIRGILIGSALGAIATSLRYIIGVENRYLG